MSNPLLMAKQELATLEAKYYWLKGFGTGWKGSHYGIGEGVYRAVWDRAHYLRQEIMRMQKATGPHKGTSLVAHRGWGRQSRRTPHTFF